MSRKNLGEHLFNGTDGEREELHTHHKVQVKDGGMENIENLVHLHKTCHQQLHNKKTNVVSPEGSIPVF